LNQLFYALTLLAPVFFLQEQGLSGGGFYDRGKWGISGIFLSVRILLMISVQKVPCGLVAWLVAFLWPYLAQQS